MDTHHIISYPSSCVGHSERPHCQRGRPTQARRETVIERVYLRAERTTTHITLVGKLRSGESWGLLKFTQLGGDRPVTRTFLHMSLVLRCCCHFW